MQSDSISAPENSSVLMSLSRSFKSSLQRDKSECKFVRNTVVFARHHTALRNVIFSFGRLDPMNGQRNSPGLTKGVDGAENHE